MSPSRLFSYRYWIVLPVLFLLTMSSSLAQIFKVYQPDVSKYPKVSSYYTATQQVGQDVVDISGLDSADFEVVENGIRIDPKTVTKRCSTIVDGPSVCVVLVIDKSGSMGEVVDQLVEFGREPVGGGVPHRVEPEFDGLADTLIVHRTEFRSRRGHRG